MKLNDEEKKYILNEYLRNISHLQDEDYQERVWIAREGPECQAFDDAVCDFFDIGEPIFEDYKDFGITDGQYQILKKFRDEFEAFTEKPGLEYYLPQFFIDKPEWEHIMKMAKEVLDVFNYPNKKSVE